MFTVRTAVGGRCLRNRNAVSHRKRSPLKKHIDWLGRCSDTGTENPATGPPTQAREYVEILLQILRDRDNPAHTAALQAVLGPGTPPPGSWDFKDRLEQLYQSAQETQRGAEGTGLLGNRVRTSKT